MLTAALVSRVLAEQPEVLIEVVAVERDPAVLPHLRATLAECERAGDGRVVAEVVEADFILESTGPNAALCIDGRFDLVIENPPYAKLAVASTHRAAMRAVGVDAPNLYAAFLACPSRRSGPADRLWRSLPGRSSTDHISGHSAPTCSTQP